MDTYYLELGFVSLAVCVLNADKELIMSSWEL